MPQLHGGQALLLGLPHPAGGEGGGKIMSMDRRKFLKVAGISSILGFGASMASATHPTWQPALRPEQMDRNKEALRAKRWAMVVDMSKFKSEEDFQKTITACHSIHNVPDFRKPDGSPDRKFEIKWIWK